MYNFEDAIYHWSWDKIFDDSTKHKTIQHVIVYNGLKKQKDSTEILYNNRFGIDANIVFDIMGDSLGYSCIDGKVRIEILVGFYQQGLLIDMVRVTHIPNDTTKCDLGLCVLKERTKERHFKRGDKDIVPPQLWSYFEKTCFNKFNELVSSMKKELANN